MINGSISHTYKVWHIIIIARLLKKESASFQNLYEHVNKFFPITVPGLKKVMDRLVREKIVTVNKKYEVVYLINHKKATSMIKYIQKVICNE